MRADMFSIFQDLTTAEIWKPVRNYEGLYEVSDKGRIRHACTRGGRGGTRYQRGTIREPLENLDGYKYISLTNSKGEEKKPYVHRLVMEAFEPCDDMENLDVNHEDGDKGNCEITNLTWMTHKANMRHAREVLDAWNRNKRYLWTVTPEQHTDVEGILAKTEETFAGLVQRLITQEAARLNLPFCTDNVVSRRQPLNRKRGKPRRPVTRLLF